MAVKTMPDTAETFEQQITSAYRSGERRSWEKHLRNPSAGHDDDRAMHNRRAGVTDEDAVLADLAVLTAVLGPLAAAQALWGQP